MILSFLAGAYCLATYYGNRNALWDALDKRDSWKTRLWNATVFALSPIVVPIGILILIIVY